MYAKHFPDVWAGRVFSQSTGPTGVAIPLYSGTSAAGGVPILNPAGSGVNIELISVEFGYASGTAAITPIGLFAGFCPGIGSANGCSAFAVTTAVNANLGIIGGSKVMSSNSGAVTVTAATLTPPVNGIAGAGWVRGVASINLESTASGTPVPTTFCYLDFDGSVLIPPGMIVYFAGFLASVAAYATTVVWKEIPITGR